MSETDERADLGARLKTAREYRGYSQDDVARYLELSRSAISLIESGNRKLDILELRKLAKLFECSAEELTGQAAPPNSSSVEMVARAAATLSDEDRQEVLRFVDFLLSRKPKT